MDRKNKIRAGINVQTISNKLACEKLIDLVLFLSENLIKIRTPQSVTTWCQRWERIGNSSYSTDSSYGDIYASPSHRTFILVEREFKEMLPKLLNLIL